MLQTISATAAIAPGARLQTAARRLADALPRRMMQVADTAWQDGLDFLAVIAQIKPCCLVGRGGNDAEWSALLEEMAAAAGLPVVEGPPWQAEAPEAILPAWYQDAVARQASRQRCLYLCRDAEVARSVAALCRQGRVSAAAEAAILGYPRCCVAQHHRQAIALESLAINLLERSAAGDTARMARLVETGALPLPRTERDWQDHAEATAIAPCPNTSINMCPACAAADDTPAARLSQRYQALAVAAGYPQCLSTAPVARLQ